ncbi:MAG: alpha-L-rhamnosidase N-terminal domain-containing protein [Lentisphaeria bacterium]|nr:alpha-L-rhamnosidase N-terminal domain-containing protein [Lentisphaeria bacterium]
MKTIFSIFLIACMPFLQAATYWNLSWSGPHTLEKEAVKVVDDSTTGANFLTSEAFAVDFTRPFKYTVEARCNVVAPGRTQGYLLVYDKNDKCLADYGTQSLIDNTDWTLLAREIPADTWPAQAHHCRLMLQPAAGIAEGTGTAWFRKLSFGSVENPLPLPGVECTKDYLFKYHDIVIQDSALKKFPYENAPEGCQLELMRQNPAYAEAVQFLTDNDLGTVLRAAKWLEQEERYGEWQELPLQVVPRGYQADLTPFGAWRKLAIVFPGQKRVILDTAKLSCLEMTEENWNAYWIWFTKDRVESVTIYLRKEFELEQVPTKAMWQCAFDDGGTVDFNGKAFGNVNGRFTPPDDDVSALLQPGKNVISVSVTQGRYAAGFLGELDMDFADGTSRKLITDHTWKFFPSDAEIRRQSEGAEGYPPPEGWRVGGFDDSSWGHCVEIARPPQGDWGKITYRVHAPRLPITLLSDAHPSTIQAGQEYTQTIRLRANAPMEGNRPVTLHLTRNEHRIYEWNVGYFPSGQMEIELPFTFHLTPYAVPGDYQMELCIPGFTAVTAEGVSCARRVMTVLNDRTAEIPDARLIRDANGVPTLTIDGTPCHSIFSARFAEEITQHAAMFSKSGLHLYHIYLTPQWPKPNTPDYNNVDALMENYLQGDPDAKVIIKLELRDGRPGWYLTQYPEDAIVFDDGHSGSHISLASRRWKELVADYFRGLIAHVKASPYADRVIGYMPYEGEEGQWMHYWNGDDPKRGGVLSDYSKPMLAYFRKWLERQYGTDEALQAAWNDSTVTLDTATIPTAQERTAAQGCFRVFPENRKAADFGWALSDVISEGIDFYTKIIKEETDGKALTGALYGHLMDLGSTFLGEQVGYARQRLAVETPYVDYYAGPISYSHRFRDVGYPGGYDMPSPATLALRGKLWINENDLRTHLQFPADYAYSVRTPADTTQIIAREFARALCLRSGYYLYALGVNGLNWFDDPETMQTIEGLRELGEKTIDGNRASASEMASFFDDEAQCRLNQNAANGQERGINGLAIMQREALFRVGGPVDEYLQFDIASPELPKYKFYTFLNPYHLTQEQIQAIRKIAADPSVKILFAFTPGIAADNGFSTETAEALTGMTYAFDKKGRAGALRTCRPFGKLPQNAAFGPHDFTIAPIAIPTGHDELLAEFQDGTPAVVRKGNIYVSCVADLPVEILREIAREAGVHLYSEDDIAVYACQDFAAFHSARKIQQCTFRAPEGKLLKQLWPVEESQAVKEVRWKNTAPITRIYRLINGKR